MLPDGTRRVLNSKATFKVPEGVAVWFRAPGSGGYGPPEERDPEALQRDLVDGYVSAEAARRDYKHVPQ